MRLRLVRISEELRASYWFLPTLMSVAAAGLAWLTVRIDARGGGAGELDPGWIYSGGADGARALLSTLAGAVMSTAGVTFSITIAVLSLASGQFGPRLLRNFIRDRGSQVVLGTFLATFLYSLLVLRTIRSEDEGVGFVPDLSVTVAVGLAVASLGVLIYFIHHVAVSIQAPWIVESVARDLMDDVEQVFPRRREGAAGPRETEPRLDVARGATVAAVRDGYVQALDEARLVRLAERIGGTVRVDPRPGAFVVHGTTLARVWPAAAVDDALADEVRRAFVLGRERTQTQDVEFGVDQLVEVAVRALSPAVNDPFTAIHCVDALSAALARAARRDPPPTVRCGSDGQVRLVYRCPVSYTGLIDSAFNQIRQYGRGSAAVLLRLLEAIARVAVCADGAEERQALLTHAEMVRRAALETLTEPRDRTGVEERFEEVLRVLGQGGDGVSDGDSASARVV